MHLTKSHTLLSCTSPLKCRYIEFEHLSDVSESWDALLPENHHLKSAQLTVLENCRPEDMRFSYLLVMDNDEPKGLIYLQHFDFNSRHFNTTALDKPGFNLFKPLITRQHIHLLICGNLFRIDFQGYYFKDPKDNTLIFDVLNDYCMKCSSKTTYCGILLKDCQQPLEPALLKASKFKPFRDDITMELHIRPEWQSFDDYLKCLSRKYLQRAKKIIKASEGYTKRELNAESIETLGPRIEELYAMVAGKQSIRMGFLNCHYFTEMKKALGADFKMTGYFIGDTMIAFNSMIFYGSHMEIHYIGMDYEYNNEYKLYFNILFDGIKEAIAGGYSRIELGRTAREAKASAGAVPVEIFNYIRVRRGLPAIAFTFFTHFFNRNVGEEWQNRNPFREQTSNTLS